MADDALLQLIELGRWRPASRDGVLAPGPEGLVRQSTPDQAHLPADVGSRRLSLPGPVPHPLPVAVTVNWPDTGDRRCH